MRRAAALGALALLAAGCGSGAGSYSYSGQGPTQVVDAQLGSTGSPSTVQVHVGQVVSIPVVGLEEAAAAPSGILTMVNAGDAVVDFRAVHPGRATVTVTRAATCSPGEACSKLVLVVGSVQVTVTG